MRPVWLAELRWSPSKSVDWEDIRSDWFRLTLSLVTENGYQGILRLKNLQELSSEHISATKLNWFLTPSDLEQISTGGDDIFRIFQVSRRLSYLLFQMLAKNWECDWDYELGLLWV